MLRCSRFALPFIATALMISACVDEEASDDPDALDPDASPEDAGGPADGSGDASADVEPEPQRCNGYAALCDRPFNEVVLAGTHNAMSTEAEGFIAANQLVPFEDQLAQGIRAMLLDTYLEDGTFKFCHSNCAFGQSDALERLGVIRSFLEANPNEVMTFIFQDGMDMADSVRLLQESGFEELALVPPAPGEPWPTLAEMIAANTRVLLTHESGDESPAWFPPAWDVFFDTPYSFASVEEFSCRVNRGNEDNPLFLINHWVNDPLPDPTFSELANAWDVMWQRMTDCEARFGRKPNVLAVDHSSIGDVMEVVNALNGVGPVR